MNRNEWLETLPTGKVWAELGVFLGDFSKEIYRVCKPSRLYLVDTFPEYENSGDKDGNNVQTKNLTNVPSELKSFFNDENVKIHKSTTHDFLKCGIVKDDDLDCVYIDADHSYESVKSDLRLVYPLVKKGGIISGHDYHQSFYPGVYNAVNEFCNEHGLKLQFVSTDRLPTYMLIK